jgi:hypothetical protein
MQSQKNEFYIRKLKIKIAEDHEDQDHHSHWRPPPPPRGSYLRIRSFPSRHRKCFVTNISLRVSKTQLGLVGFNRVSIRFVWCGVQCSAVSCEQLHDLNSKVVLRSEPVRCRPLVFLIYPQCFVDKLVWYLTMPIHGSPSTHDRLSLSV